jgi:hypothetical protein
MKKIQKFLKAALVTQEMEDERGRTRRRLNPLNPLSYVVFIAVIIVVVFNYIRDAIKEIDSEVNPFKWQ